MYIAMNRFKVATGSEEAFEAIWKGRDSRLSELAGFISFQLLKGKSFTDEGYTLYASHTMWESEEAFTAWTRSEQFRDAHRNAGERKAEYLGPPVFEGFNTVEGA
ncbi:antibiotic biosynthesis monooxygenase family protein [Martelella endophytica]|uniref:Antibiotic biosynthesis monooxygenase n=1 Tax=Martelella endophytica TaxID=1486262 RepID=A0A0D5LPH0_MAREN|nr:antibiotic biosynthesis monooxygenase [Martelella endophytica]AJY46119.1 antibiotic biosynthesis monooxygenase [Martelella endophytica]